MAAIRVSPEMGYTLLDEIKPVYLTLAGALWEFNLELAAVASHLVLLRSK
jgi:hypothetical protein